MMDIQHWTCTLMIAHLAASHTLLWQLTTLSRQTAATQCSAYLILPFNVQAGRATCMATKLLVSPSNRNSKCPGSHNSQFVFLRRQATNHAVRCKIMGGAETPSSHMQYHSSSAYTVP
jgi:hypothetical protein